MVKIIMVSHGLMAQELKTTAEMICGPVTACQVLSLGAEDDVAALAKAMEDAAAGGGLILVDMPGGSPFNGVSALMGREDVQVITGMNLPMVLALFTQRTKMHTVADLADLALSAGVGGIFDVGVRLRRVPNGCGQGDVKHGSKEGDDSL